MYLQVIEHRGTLHELNRILIRLGDDIVSVSPITYGSIKHGECAYSVLHKVHED